MGAFTNYGSTTMLTSLFVTNPGPFYLALLTAVPDGNPTGASLSEPSGSGYARKSYASGSSYWNFGISGVQNASAVKFNTASGDWGRIVAWALCDASTGGNVYACGELSQSLVVQSGSTVTLPAEALVLRLL